MQSEVTVKNQERDYFPITANTVMFYSPYTTTICQRFNVAEQISSCIHLSYKSDKQLFPHQGTYVRIFIINTHTIYLYIYIYM